MSIAAEPIWAHSLKKRFGTAFGRAAFRQQTLAGEKEWLHGNHCLNSPNLPPISRLPLPPVRPRRHRHPRRELRLLVPLQLLLRRHHLTAREQDCPGKIGSVTGWWQLSLKLFGWF